MNGKGDKRRPTQVSDEELRRRWADTFNPEHKESGEDDVEQDQKAADLGERRTRR